MEKEVSGTKDAANTLVRPLQGGSEMFLFSKNFIVIMLVVAVFGVGTGFVFSRSSSPLSVAKGGLPFKKSAGAKGTVVGSKDTKAFKDSAEGAMREGGIDGEGQFHLERPGGESQNVYLTSSVIDLSPFIGQKVKVWGQTYAAKKAGWLMDVGRLEIL